MSDDLKDILSNDNKNIDPRQLMEYLNNQLSDTNKHDIEKNMAADDFMNDAVEGLQEFNTSKDIPLFVDQLNRDLQKKTAKNRRHKEKRQWKEQPYTYISIIVILLLIIVSFFIIKRFLTR